MVYCSAFLSPSKKITAVVGDQQNLEKSLQRQRRTFADSVADIYNLYTIDYLLSKRLIVPTQFALSKDNLHHIGRVLYSKADETM